MLDILEKNKLRPQKPLHLDLACTEIFNCLQWHEISDLCIV